MHQAEPQLWWDAFRYAVSLGHPHGLVGFMPGAAIALPLADPRHGVVSCCDVPYNLHMWVTVFLNMLQPSRDSSTVWWCHSNGAGGASQY